MQIDRRYDVIRSLGSGGMGAVYLAADRLRDGQHVAVKAIRDSRTAFWFEREFRLLSRLNHPNLARVFDFGFDEASGQHYFSAEFVDGEPLAWAGAGRPFEWLVERTVQLLRALGYVHQDGLLHCDVKPENVLVERETGRVRLLDFGVAMAAPAEAVLPRGTLPYMAPEWIRGATPDTRADLYGLGMLLYRVSAGRFPFDPPPAAASGTARGASKAAAGDPEHGRDAILRFHLEEPARFPDDLPGVPAWWGNLVERLLAKQPADRFPSVQAVLREINLRAGADYALDTAETWAERLRGGRWVGRDDATTALRAALDAATAPREPEDAPQGPAPDAPVLVVVEGAPGIGKSRLLRELKRGYQLRRVPVLLESGASGGTLEALLGSIRCLLGEEDPAWRKHGDALQSIARRSAGEADGHGDPGADARVDARIRRVEEAGELLLSAGAVEPLVVLLDDGQALDALTADVVSWVLHAIDYRLTQPAPASGPPPRLVFVVARRDGADGDGPLADLLGHRLTTRVTLPALAPAEVPALLRTVLGERALPDGLEGEVRAAGGNPGFVVALLSYLIERGRLRVERGALRFTADATATAAVPQTLEESLRGVVDALAREEREALVLLSLAPLPYPATVLADALGTDPEEVVAVLQRLEARGLVASDPSREGAPLGPASRTLAAVVAGALASDECVVWHRRLLAALRDAPEPFATPTALACHLEAAGEWGDGAAQALLAAREARLRGSHDVALGWLDRARRMAAQRGDVERTRAVAEEETTVRTLQGAHEEAARVVLSVLGEPGADAAATLADDERAAWLLRLGDVRHRQGDHDGAVAALGDALRAAEAAGDERLQAASLALEGRVEFFRGGYEAARALAERALALVGDDANATAGRAESTLGLVEAYVGAPDAALAHLERAEAVFRALDDRRELAFVANSQGLVHHRRGAPAAAIEAYERSLSFAREVGDQRRETIARMNLSVAYQETGQYREAIEQYLESLERAYRVQDRESLMRVSNNLGNIHRFLGRLDEAAAWVGRSLVQAHALEAKLFTGYNNLILGEINLLRGEREAARRRIWEAEGQLRDLKRPEAWLESKLDQVAWLRQGGELEEAEREARDVAERAATEDLPDHRARALLELSTLALFSAERFVAGAAGRAVARGLEALALIEPRDAPELQWRVCAGLARAYTAFDGVAAARYFLSRTAAARAQLEERIPAEMRPTFFERRDRRELHDAVDAAAARLQTAHPGDRMAPAQLLPAGASLLRLLEVNKQLNSEYRLDVLLSMIMDAVIDLTGAERGFIILRQEGKLQVEVARNIDRETIRRSKYKISQSIAEEVIEAGVPVFTTDAQDDERYRDYVSIHALKLRSIVCIPLKDRDQTFGAIYLDNRFQANAFNEEHRGLLEAFAEQAAVALTNARLHERNRVILEELKRSNEQVERLNRELERKLVDQTAQLAETREALTRRQDQLEQRYRYGQIIGHSPGIQRVYGLIDRVKEIDVPVIIQGDSGTGKELVARAIHYNGARRKEEFVSINCAAFPETLLESELFGHKRGSFTGADRDKKGLFQVAHRGTLFLDEVGDMSLGMQAKLLRALQEHEVRPVGGHEAVKVDVRIIAASNQDLKELIRLGRFREDLFYRLNVVTIRIPPLRERREDIPLLVEHFLERAATRTGGQKRDISKDAMKVLMNYGWPGNVRELESTVTTASLFALTPEIQIADLSNKPELLEAGVSRPMSDLGERTLAELEREAIIQALVRTKGNKMATAKALGISRRSLYNKLTQYDIQLTRKTTIVR